MWKRISSLCMWMSAIHSMYTRRRQRYIENDAHCSVVNRNAISMCIGFNVCAHGFSLFIYLFTMRPHESCTFWVTLYKCVYSFINRHLWHSHGTSISISYAQFCQFFMLPLFLCIFVCLFVSSFVFNAFNSVVGCCCSCFYLLKKTKHANVMLTVFFTAVERISAFQRVHFNSSDNR